MEKTLILTIENKRYSLKGYSGSYYCILQVEDLKSGKWYKKNIYMKSDPNHFYILQKTRIKTAYSPEIFVGRLQNYVNNNFCMDIVKKILCHMETMKDATI